MANMDIVDEIEMECKVDEYAKLMKQRIGNMRSLMGFGKKVFQKSDNQMVQNLVIIGNIDDTIARGDRLKANWK